VDSVRLRLHDIKAQLKVCWLSHSTNMRRLPHATVRNRSPFICFSMVCLRLPTVCRAIWCTTALLSKHNM
jgi:hypothetical protein